MEAFEKWRNEWQENERRFNEILRKQLELNKAMLAYNRKIIRELNRPLAHSCFYRLGFKEAANIRELCEN